MPLMDAIPPANPTKIAILVHPRSSAALALLAQELFQRARLAATLVGREPIRGDQWSLDPAPWEGAWDLVLVPPFAPGLDGEVDPEAPEVAWLRRQGEKGIRIASACVGAFLLGAAGLLDGREATTHWLWAAAARDQFPHVHWQPDQMLCDAGPVITAGGYLALVDLVLTLIQTFAGRSVAQDVAHRVLADTSRQKQSVYAQTLTLGTSDPGFAGFDRWVDEHLARPLGVNDLAHQVGMSPRSFFRRFRVAYGLTPGQYLQQKRIERAQRWLRDTDASLETILDSLGVTDGPAFRHLFRRELGLSPSEYRRRFRNPTEQSPRTKETPSPGRNPEVLGSEVLSPTRTAAERLPNNES